MSIRTKLVLIILPLTVLSMAIIATSSALAARNGITRVAIEFLAFKAEQLESYAQEQWDLLVNNDLQGREDLVAVSRQSVIGRSLEMIRSEGELIFAVEDGSRIAFATRPVEPEALRLEEWQRLLALADAEERGWVELTVRDEPRVGYTFGFEPFGWQLFVTEAAETFYLPVTQIIRRSVLISLIVVAIASLALILLSSVLTRPLAEMVTRLQHIIDEGDLSTRVAIRYDDEVGRLGHTFNTMMSQLEASYRQIKDYALDAAIAERNEKKIRNIFQKYVPNDVIETIFTNPESMLVGDTRNVAILFSDIRSFTTISESSRPDELVANLNRYFSILVDIIMDRRGIVDKYIGDAVMAFFGAPVRHENDALDAVEAAVAIVDALEIFNREQDEAELPRFMTGLGINYGEVTVGNIGSERKMDYTVIGDTVNLASRLEGLTKFYGQPLIISSSVRERVGDAHPCRLVDTVVVKGKTVGERIYTTRSSLSDSEREAWKLHDSAMERFYARDFAGADRLFTKLEEHLPEDALAPMFRERCATYRQTPPPQDWNGAWVMTSK